VRVYKNLRNTLIQKVVIKDGVAPSYFIEGLLYNVPAAQFGGTEQQNFLDTLKWLIAADRSKFECANGQFYLLGNTNVTWPAANCETFLNAAMDYWTTRNEKGTTKPAWEFVSGGIRRIRCELHRRSGGADGLGIPDFPRRQGRQFGNFTATLTSEDSNHHIPKRKKAFEKSGEFPLF
jgi:hypothetical protein